jgi:hypothetical protein
MAAMDSTVPSSKMRSQISGGQLSICLFSCRVQPIFFYQMISNKPSAKLEYDEDRTHSVQDTDKVVQAISVSSESYDGLGRVFDIVSIYFGSMACIYVCTPLFY